MNPTNHHNEDDILLAAEYALHLLDADARGAFKARLSREPGLRDLLGEWDEDLISLADEFAPVAPGPEVKSRIEARLFTQAKAAKTRRWSVPRFAGGMLAGLALAFVLLMVLPVTQFGPAAPDYVAEIAAEDRTIVVTARYDSAGNSLLIERLAGGPAPGRALELWLIAEGADTPVSLGILPSEQSATLDISAEHSAALAGATLAISDEPLGGSPTGQPTGAVLAVVSVRAI